MTMTPSLKILLQQSFMGYGAAYRAGVLQDYTMRAFVNKVIVLFEQTEIRTQTMVFLLRGALTPGCRCFTSVRLDFLLTAPGLPLAVSPCVRACACASTAW